MINLRRRGFLFGASAAIITPPVRSIFIMPAAPKFELLEEFIEWGADYESHLIIYDTGQMAMFLANDGKFKDHILRLIARNSMEISEQKIDASASPAPHR